MKRVVVTYQGNNQPVERVQTRLDPMRPLVGDVMESEHPFSDDGDRASHVNLAATVEYICPASQTIRTSKVPAWAPLHASRFWNLVPDRVAVPEDGNMFQMIPMLPSSQSLAFCVNPVFGLNSVLRNGGLKLCQL